MAAAADGLACVVSARSYDGAARECAGIPYGGGGGGALLHAGGALSDALIPCQSAGTLRKVFAPKISGLRGCNTVSGNGGPAHAGLAVELVFSSISALLGSPGQVRGSM
jgi:hypothetical protein